MSVNIDGLTQMTVTGGADHMVKFWKFKTCELLNQLKMDAAVARAVMHRDRLTPLLSVCLSVCLSVSLSLCLSLCLSVSLPVETM